MLPLPRENLTRGVSNIEKYVHNVHSRKRKWFCRKPSYFLLKQSCPTSNIMVMESDKQVSNSSQKRVATKSQAKEADKKRLINSKKRETSSSKKSFWHIFWLKTPWLKVGLFLTICTVVQAYFYANCFMTLFLFLCMAYERRFVKKVLRLLVPIFRLWILSVAQQKNSIEFCQ